MAIDAPLNVAVTPSPAANRPTKVSRRGPAVGAMAQRSGVRRRPTPAPPGRPPRRPVPPARPAPPATAECVRGRSDATTAALAIWPLSASSPSETSAAARARDAEAGSGRCAAGAVDSGPATPDVDVAPGRLQAQPAVADGSATASRSPGRAPLRSTALPAGTQPSSVPSGSATGRRGGVAPRRIG